MALLKVTFLLVMGTPFCIGQESATLPVNNERKVKGQQFVTQTVVAKIIGPNKFSDDFLALLRNDSNSPIVVDNNMLVEGLNDTVSALVTENVKTTVTRITIPLSTRYMDSYWYRETLRKFLEKNRIALTNIAIHRDYSENGINMDLITLKLWTGAILRDNIVTVFGTLLYNPERKLSGDLQGSLAHLYNLIRLRRIPTIPFLDALEKMSIENSHEQFKILFEKIERYAPKYIKSCATFWLENLYANTINMNELLIGKNLNANFLSGISRRAMILLKEKSLFPKNTVMGARAQDEELMGEMLSYILSGVRDQSMILTRKLLGGILMHLPVNKLNPQADEYQRFFMELVESNRLQENIFQKAVVNLNLQQNPFELVREIFHALLSADHCNRKLYESILVNIQLPTNTYTLRDYDVMSPIISSTRINIRALLSNIAPDEYPLDVVNAKNTFLDYIEKCYIDQVLQELVKYEYSTPNEILIATLTRLQVRLPNLPPEVYLAITDINTYITAKTALNNLRLRFSVEDLTTLFLLFERSDFPQSLRDIVAYLRVRLQPNFIEVNPQSYEESMAKCSGLCQCTVSILKYLTKGNILDAECAAKAEEMLTLIEEFRNL